MRLLSHLAVLSAAAFVAACALASEIHVPVDYSTIESAIDASSDGDIVIVSPGRYVENIDFKGKAIMLTSINPRNTSIVESTIIDGNQAGACVLFCSNELPSSVLRGFTITNGKGLSPSECGSGISCLGASPLIMDCRIVANQGHRLVAGGIGLSFSAAIIMNCLIEGNTTVAAESAGMLCYGSDVTIIDCEIADNTARGQGSAITCRYSTVFISGTRIERNGRAESALYFWHSSAILIGSTISGNHCSLWNVDLLYSSIRMANTTIADNRGYGMIARRDTVITNCIFHGNLFYGGGEFGFFYPRNIYVVGFPLSIDHTLISNIEETVLIVEGAQVTWGPGIIDADPMFVRPGYWDDNGTPDTFSDDIFIPGDYHLLPGSPCIDAGTNNVDNPDTPEVETLPATDLSGLPRVIDGNLDGVATVDIGAYEYLPGDVNYDGRVNVLDLLLVRNSLGRDPASSIEARKADVNADGSVNVQDLLVVRGRLGR